MLFCFINIYSIDIVDPFVALGKCDVHNWSSLKNKQEIKNRIFLFFGIVIIVNLLIIYFVFVEAQELLLDIYERLDDLGADKVNIEWFLLKNIFHKIIS